MIKIDSLFFSKDALLAVHGSTKPIFRWVEGLVEALVYMILHGEKSLLQGYNFMVKDSSEQSTRTSMPLLLFLYLWTDTSLLARSNSLYQFAVSPPSTPSRKFKSGAWFIKHFLSLAVWFSPRNFFPVPDCIAIDIFKQESGSISVAEHRSRWSILSNSVVH